MWSKMRRCPSPGHQRMIAFGIRAASHSAGWRYEKVLVAVPKMHRSGDLGRVEAPWQALQPVVEDAPTATGSNGSVTWVRTRPGTPRFATEHRDPAPADAP